MNTQTQQCHSELTRSLPKYLIVEERKICLKSDKNIGHFTSRPKGALLLLATWIRHKIIYCATLNIFALFTATCGSTMLRRMCTVRLVTLLGSVSFRKMSENVHGLIRYTYLHFTPQAISCGKFSPAIKLKYFTSHTFCPIRPWRPQCYSFAAEYKVSTPRAYAVPLLILQQYLQHQLLASNNNPRWKSFLRFIFLLPCPQPKLQYNRLSLKPHSPLP
jgi:hypothetical protein